MHDAAHVLHRSARRGDRSQVGAQEPVVGLRIVAIGVQLDDALLVSDWQVAHEHGVVDGEHGDGHADADGEDQNGRDRERGRAAEATQRDANVVLEPVHRASVRSVSSKVARESPPLPVRRC